MKPICSKVASRFANAGATRFLKFNSPRYFFIVPLEANSGIPETSLRTLRGRASIIAFLRSRMDPPSLPVAVWRLPKVAGPCFSASPAGLAGGPLCYGLESAPSNAAFPTVVPRSTLSSCSVLVFSTGCPAIVFYLLFHLLRSWSYKEPRFLPMIVKSYTEPRIRPGTEIFPVPRGVVTLLLREPIFES